MIKGIRGVPDILPDETGKWQALEAVARDVLDRYGYAEIRTPIFERTELFVRGIGEGTDIVEKEMYTFEERGREPHAAARGHGLANAGLWRAQPGGEE